MLYVVAPISRRHSERSLARFSSRAVFARARNAIEESLFDAANKEASANLLRPKKHAEHSKKAIPIPRKLRSTALP